MEDVRYRCYFTAVLSSVFGCPPQLLPFPSASCFAPNSGVCTPDLPVPKSPAVPRVFQAALGWLHFVPGSHCQVEQEPIQRAFSFLSVFPSPLPIFLFFKQKAGLGLVHLSSGIRGS